MGLPAREVGVRTRRHRCFALDANGVEMRVQGDPNMSPETKDALAEVAKVAYDRVLKGSAKPFVKWVGGKTKSLPVIRPHVSTSLERRFSGTYFEPFAGAASLFFDVQARGTFRRYLLADANPKLVTTYRAIRDDVEAVISRLEPMKNTRRDFESVRARNMEYGSPARLAADFLYLNRTCFNGLFRVNRGGQFNVPFGDYPEHRKLFDPENLRACSRALQGVPILCEDFRDALSFKCMQPRAGDFVYFDPPYVPVSRTSNFTSFTKGGFGEGEQRALHLLARKLLDRGVNVFLSNSDAPLVRELYANPELWDVQEVLVPRSVNSDGAKRGNVRELLIKGRVR